MQKLITLLLRGYQWFLSPLLGSHCRYTPGCSDYALDAIEKHGAGKGLWLACKRILRCHPWHQGGYDPVPEAIGTPLNRSGKEKHG
jgi:putative membrane protein insertion efficiency factor